MALMVVGGGGGWLVPIFHVTMKEPQVFALTSHLLYNK